MSSTQTFTLVVRLYGEPHHDVFTQPMSYDATIQQLKDVLASNPISQHKKASIYGHSIKEMEGTKKIYDLAKQDIKKYQMVIVVLD